MRTVIITLELTNYANNFLLYVNELRERSRRFVLPLQRGCLLIAALPFAVPAGPRPRCRMTQIPCASRSPAEALPKPRFVYEEHMKLLVGILDTEQPSRAGHQACAGGQDIVVAVQVDQIRGEPIAAPS